MTMPSQGSQKSFLIGGETNEHIKVSSDVEAGEDWNQYDE